ncbi:MAG TPA: HNH endonuclease signature motif containing protein [Noviherbaspirillum sp.]|uniref:HNH endonuclease n=1 Tax=Noviherbaspirillum sp. TaxID=1926288 RepID=UPI002DDD20D7|nr:HNH endonuclease signature motif containing protein [Noviherbaspirillum sp.]HEV2612526.1 HNH endonuclease signature motif containing protein [Noviherbaspirillum sp.]
MKLQTLKPRLTTLSTSRVQTLPNIRTGTVERKRGSAGVKDRNNIRKRDCGLCQECKRKGIVSLGQVVDHIHPLWDGGSDEDDNKELLCVPCHDVKTAREAKQRAGGSPIFGR